MTNNDNNKMLLWVIPLALLLSHVACAQPKISILGDSYSTFYGHVEPEENLCWYGVPGENKKNDVIKVQDTWWNLLVETGNYQLECNNSYSGSTVCNTGYNGADYSDRSFITRMTALGTPDIIIVFGGTNDSWAGVPIGENCYSTWEAESLYSFRPAFCYLLDYLTHHYSSAKVFNITNTNLSEDIVRAMADICQHYNVVNICLHDIDKQQGHPSVRGMRAIASQVLEMLNVVAD